MQRVEAHTQSEFTNDIDVIMSTVSSNVCYILPDLSKDEVVLTALTSREQVRDAYVRERELLDIVRSRHLVEASSNYFVFYESLATTRGRLSGEEVDVNSAVLFPIAADGIIGELLWSNGSLGSGIRASAQGSGPSTVAGERSADPLAARRANFDAHDAFLSAWRAGDAKRVASCFDAACQWMICDHRRPSMAVTHLAARSDVARWYAELFETLPVQDVEVLQRVVETWYVYAEYAVSLQRDGQPSRTLRIGGLHPVETPGSFAGMLGFEFVTGGSDTAACVP